MNRRTQVRGNYQEVKEKNYGKCQQLAARESGSRSQHTGRSI